jgi:polysaccharide biosynthesis protein PslH
LKICLIASDNLIPATSGAPKRIFKIAESLSDCGASVYALHHGQNMSLSNNLKFLNFRSLEPLRDSGYYTHPFNPFFPKKFGDIIHKFRPDIIQCEGPWSILPTLVIAKNAGIPCVLDEHNVEFLWSLHASKLPLLSIYTFIMEKFALAKSEKILVTSENDKLLLSKLFNLPSNKIFVVPNGVDFKPFSKSMPSSMVKQKIGLSPNKKVVLFHGLLSAKQNYEAANLILDFIAPRFLDSTFLIIGKNPPNWLKSKVLKNENVRLLGFVRNIEDYIISSDICIAPIRRGSGTRLKLLEYMAAAKPIVSTVIGAEGLPLKTGINALLCKEVNSEFLDSLNYLLTNEKNALRLGLNAKETAEDFSWDKIGRSLFDFYKLSF